MPNEFAVAGLDDLLANLKKLPGRIGDNAMRRSLRKGANVIKTAAVAGARKIDDAKTREAIFKNITIVSGGKKREIQFGGPMMRVGIRKDGLGGDTFYWRFVEFGTSEMHAQPFMRPAMNEHAGEAFTAIATDMSKQIDKEMAKLKP